MLGIYIVDDEPMAVRYLEMMLQDCGFPCEVVGSQTNAVRALSEIRTLQPDIVFTDISMPVMDGLELAERVLKATDARVYLLTSYEDFEFAKRGVRIGVADYLLKNELQEAMLLGILEEAQREIESSRRERHMILEHNVRDFLLGSSAIPEDRAYQERAMQRYALLTFYRPARFWMNAEAAGEENVSLDSYALMHAEVPKGMRCTGFAQTRAREYCAIVFISETVVESERRLFQMGDGLLSRIRENDPGWKCICSDIRLRFFELQEEYQKLEKRIGYLYAQPERAVLFAHSLNLPRKEAISHEELLESCYRSLSEGKHEQAVSESEAFFDYCRRHDTQEAYMESMRSFYQMLRRCTLRDGRGIEYLALSACYTSTIDLERALLNCVELFFEERERAEGLRYSEHILRALQFIRKEYVRDISVSEIAAAVAISEGHLRRLFKQEMNMSVIDYLTEFRMQQAKYLLRERLMSASEVWKETGFSSAQYFSYVFKRREGISPRDYQKRMSFEEDGAGAGVLEHGKARKG